MVRVLLLMSITLLFVGQVLGQCSLSRDGIPLDMPAEVRQQVDGLYNPDAKTRTAAAWTLGNLGTAAAPAIPYLIDILREHGAMSQGKTFFWARPDNPWAQEITSPGHEAAKSLVRIGSASIDPLLAVLKDNPDVQARINAMFALGEFREPRAVDLLTTHANIWQYEALEALGKIRDPRCIARLMTTFNQNDGYISQVIDVLVKIGTPAVEPLLAQVKNPNAPGRHMAMVALGRIGDARGLEIVLEWLSNSEPRYQLLALTALVNFPPTTKAGPLLVNMLSSTDWQVRQKSIMALARLRDAQYVPNIVALLRDPDLTVRGYAARALGQIGAKDAANNIALLLHDKYLFPRKAAQEALTALNDARATSIDTK